MYLNKEIRFKKVEKRGFSREGYILLSILVLILLIPHAFSEEQYEQGIYFIRSESEYINNPGAIEEYLSVEDLVFLICIEDETVVPQTSVICLDNNNFFDVDAIKWTQSNNCYMSSFNLERMPCANIRVQGEYLIDDENERIYKDIKVNKLSKVLDKIIESQYTDGGWKTTRDTAYGIWALSQFSEIFDIEMDKAIDWMEDQRDEYKKCWPKAECNIPLSMEILYVLTMSGYDDARRVVNDARNYIENRQNYFESGDQFSVELEAFVPDTTFVLVALNREILDDNMSIDNGTVARYTFKVNMNDTLYVLSYENFQAVVKNIYGEEIYRYQGNNLSYTFEGACWSSKVKGEPCDARTTAFASLLDLRGENLREARRWMSTKIRFPFDVGAYFFDGNQTLDTSLFILSFHNQTDYDTYGNYFNRYSDFSDQQSFERYLSELEKWLLFNQNNEGSWGTRNGSTVKKAVPTAYAVHALMEIGHNRTYEPIEDAERWMSLSEDDLDKNDTISMGSAFYLLRNNARPMVTVSPGVVIIKEPTTVVEISNPTTFNLKELSYEISSELEDYIEITEKEQLSAYSYRRIKIQRKSSPSGDVFGYLIIKNIGIPIGKIPIIMTNVPEINISYPSNLIVFGNRITLPLTITKSGHEFMCSASWDSSEVSSPSSFKINGNSFNIEMLFSDSVTKEDIYSGKIICKVRSQEYSFPLSVYVTRYASLPLTVTPKEITINRFDEDINFIVKNNLDRDITSSITVRGGNDYFQIPSSINLDPNEARNITFRSIIPEDTNFTGSIFIQFESLGKQSEISVFIDLLYENKETSLLLTLLILIIIFSFLGAGGYFAYKNRKMIIEYFEKLNTNPEKVQIKKSIKELDELRKKEMTDAIKNFVELLRFQKKEEDEIKKILLENFKIEDIAYASKNANINLPWAEESQPEKL
jgi:hypothetical protein